MLRNKNTFKRLRNVIILGLILITMLGIYNNTIRNSKAESIAEVTVEMIDKKQLLDNKPVVVNATIIEGSEERRGKHI